MWSGGIVSRGLVKISALLLKYCSLSYFQIVHLDTGKDPKSLNLNYNDHVNAFELGLFYMPVLV